jgi:hypothetical protein
MLGDDLLRLEEAEEPSPARRPTLAQRREEPVIPQPSPQPSNEPIVPRRPQPAPKPKN